MRHLGYVRIVVCCCLVMLGGCDVFSSPERQVARAEAQMTRGNYGAAMQDLKTVLQKSPENVAARIALARLSLQLGDGEAADKELQRAYRAGADPAKYRELECSVALARGQFEQVIHLLAEEGSLPGPSRWMFLGIAQTGLKQWGDADLSFGEALRLNPRDPVAMVERAKLRMEQGSPEEAFEYAQRALREYPQFSRARLVQAALYMQKGAHLDAIAAFKAAQESGEGTLSLPEKVQAATGLAEAHLARNDTAAAAQSLDRLEARFGVTISSVFLRARLAFRNDEYRAAVTDFQRVLRAVPDFAPARLLLGAALLAQGAPEQAQAELARLLSQHPDDIEARKLLAQVYLARNQPDQARRTLAEGADRGAPDSQVDWLLGTAMMQTDSTDAGLARLERSVAAEPQNAVRRTDLATAYLSTGMREKALEVLQGIPTAQRTDSMRRLLLVANLLGKERSAARTALEQLIAANPTDAALIGVAGSFALASGERQLARQYLTRSVELDPKNLRALMDLARLESREGDVESATRRLQDALAVNPQFQPAYIGLSGIAWLHGRKDQAKDWLERAIVADNTAVEPRLRLAQLALGDGDMRRARGFLEQALTVGKNRGDMLNAVGEVLLRSGRLDEALARFDEAQNAGARGAAINTARAQLAMGHFDEARHTLQTSRARDAAPFVADVMLVELDARQGRVEDALARVETLRKAGFPNGAALELTGDVQMSAKRYPAAVRSYADAFGARASRALTLKNYRARTAAGITNPEAPLTEWLKGSPSDRSVRLALAEYYQRVKRRADAIREYETLAARHQRDPVVLNNLAWLYYEGRDPRSIAMAKEAYGLAPQLAAVGDTYGWLLVEQGSAKDGLPILQRAAQTAPDDAGIRYHLAAAYARNGDRAQAMELLSGLLKLKNEFAERADAQKLLQTLAAG